MKKILLLAGAIALSTNAHGFLDRIKGALGLQRDVAGSSASTAGSSLFGGKSIADLEASRIERWETTIKALNKYGANDDIIKWAERNLKRAQHDKKYPGRARTRRRAARSVAASTPAKAQTADRETVKEEVKKELAKAKAKVARKRRAAAKKRAEAKKKK